MKKIHIEKGSVQETLIIPLYGRKLCAEHWDVMETLAEKETWQNQNGKF